MMTKQQLKALATFDSRGFPVVSFYLNVDGRFYSPIQNAERTHQLVRQARQQLSAHNLSPQAQESVQQDLDHITRYVGAEFERGAWRGLALFSCSARGFWQAYPLPAPLPDRIRVEAGVCLRPLVGLCDDFARAVLALVDRERARLFVLEQEEIRESKTIFEEAPVRSRVGSHYGLADLRIARHIEEHVHRHLQHTAAALDDLVEQEGVERILLGGPSETVAEFRRVFPERLAGWIVGEVSSLMLIASPKEVLSQSLEALEEAERREEAALVQEVREGSGPGGSAVTGLAETLRALYQQAVRKLIVEREFSVSGRLCAECGRLFSSGPCPECGASETHPVGDLAEAAMSAALRQEAEVEIVSSASEWFREVGIGALLRFPLPLPERARVAPAGA